MDTLAQDLQSKLSTNDTQSNQISNFTTNSINNNNDNAEPSETSDRPLAYIHKIQSLRPIEGADVIEVATVLGWHVVVKKNLYKESDYVVYVEIDR